ncbi:MAG TPA: FadR/GntR family transcriptional regulator [Rectinemataceae bacterium]|nr:FadR/GntR family transcriptional regulator [Rectinemataceae bacterium]
MIPVKKVPITEQVVKKIMDSITSGSYAEGSKLPPEQALCKELNVGRSTIREAFRVLQTMGYVELKPGKGAYVYCRTGDDSIYARNWFKENVLQLKDFIEAREAIETLAIKVAIEKGTKEEFLHIEAIHDEFLNAATSNDSTKLALLDKSFHEFIVSMTHNHLLIKMYNTVSKAFEEYRSISFSVPMNVESAIYAHTKIVRAMKQRDTSVAVESVVYHLNRVISDMENEISE